MPAPKDAKLRGLKFDNGPDVTNADAQQAVLSFEGPHFLV